jgi:hypothetical protein
VGMVDGPSVPAFPAKCQESCAWGNTAADAALPAVPRPPRITPVGTPGPRNSVHPDPQCSRESQGERTSLCEMCPRRVWAERSESG